MSPKQRKYIRRSYAWLSWVVVACALAIDDPLTRVLVVCGGIACMGVSYWLRPLPVQEGGPR